MDYEKETFERKPALMLLWAKSAADLNYVLSELPQKCEFRFVDTTVPLKL